MSGVKTRNTQVDIIRGIAILLVVLGHVIPAMTANPHDSWVFNVIWSLQMPLFFLLSGYVTRYSRPLQTGKDLGKFIGKKALAYLLPWLVWTFLVRAWLMGQSQFFDVAYLLYHMDTGYWFLVSLFVITVVFGVSQWVAGRFAKQPIARLLWTVAGCLVGVVVIAAIGLVAGMGFLGTKLTLYYLPFFGAGWLYGQLCDDIDHAKHGKTVVSIVVAVSLIVYVALMMQFKVAALGEGLTDIAVRLAASLTGCVALCGLVGNMKLAHRKTGKLLTFFGQHSLEVYLSHYLFLPLVALEHGLDATFLLSGGVILMAYIVVVLLDAVLIGLLNRNTVLRKVLFWK